MWPVKALQQIGSGGYIMVLWCLLDPSWVGIAVWSSHNTRRDSKAAGYGKSSRTWGIHSCSISVVSYANVKSQYCALLAWTVILATAWIEDIILVTFFLQNIFLSRSPYYFHFTLQIALTCERVRKEILARVNGWPTLIKTFCPAVWISSVS
jgi:hypothetical protein